MPEAPAIALVPLNDTEYAEFADLQVPADALQHVNAGEWESGEAPGGAREELADLLEDRLRDAGHVFLKGVRADGTPVAWVWVAAAPEFLGAGCERIQWLAQITVQKDLRGRGYGRVLLEALHRRLEAQGVDELWLRVFDWNDAARRLYARAGYELARQFPTDAHLCKRLSPMNRPYDTRR